MSAPHATDRVGPPRFWHSLTFFLRDRYRDRLRPYWSIFSYGGKVFISFIPTVSFKTVKKSLIALRPSSQPARAVGTAAVSISTGKSRRMPAVALLILAAAASKRNCASRISSAASGGHAQAQNAKGVGELALDATGIALSAVVVDLEELANFAPRVGVRQQVVQFKEIKVSGRLEGNAVLQVGADRFGRKIHEGPVVGTGRCDGVSG